MTETIAATEAVTQEARDAQALANTREAARWEDRMHEIVTSGEDVDDEEAEEIMAALCRLRARGLQTPWAERTRHPRQRQAQRQRPRCPNRGGGRIGGQPQDHTRSMAGPVSAFRTGPPRRADSFSPSRPRSQAETRTLPMGSSGSLLTPPMGTKTARISLWPLFATCLLAIL